MLAFTRLFFFFMIASPFSAQAGQISFIAETARPLLQAELDDSTVGLSVGALTLSVLSGSFGPGAIPFQGNPHGLTSVAYFAQRKVEVSPEETRYYGWCFALNGVVSESAADEVRIRSSDDQIVWYYGFVTKLAGKWQENCQAESGLYGKKGFEYRH